MISVDEIESDFNALAAKLQHTINDWSDTRFGELLDRAIKNNCSEGKLTLLELFRFNIDLLADPHRSRFLRIIDKAANRVTLTEN
jgi:hypothetical protein